MNEKFLNENRLLKMNKIAQRYAILILHNHDQTIKEIHQYLVDHAGHDAYSRSAVGKWVQKIKLGRTDLSNQKQPGRPKDDLIREEVGVKSRTIHALVLET